MAIIGDQIGVPFTQEEYDERLRRVRSVMEKKGIEVLMVREPINVHYLTGYNTIGLSNYEILFITLEGDPTLLVRFLERQIAFITSRIKDVRPWEDHENPYTATRDVMVEKGWLDKKVAFEKSSNYMSVKDYSLLTGTIGIDLIDGS